MLDAGRRAIEDDVDFFGEERVWDFEGRELRRRGHGRRPPGDCREVRGVVLEVAAGDDEGDVVGALGLCGGEGAREPRGRLARGEPVETEPGQQTGASMSPSNSECLNDHIPVKKKTFTVRDLEER